MKNKQTNNYTNNNNNKPKKHNLKQKNLPLF